MSQSCVGEQVYREQRIPSVPIVDHVTWFIRHEDFSTEEQESSSKIDVLVELEEEEEEEIVKER